MFIMCTYCFHIIERFVLSNRRGSMWGGPPMQQPPNSQTIKDTRPVRDSNFQREMRKDVLRWLQSTGYEIEELSSQKITSRELRAIFQHLVLLIDPGYPFDNEIDIVEEVTVALKAIRYPFQMTDLRQLKTPGGSAWHSFLALLHWLTNQGRVSGPLCTHNLG